VTDKPVEVPFMHKQGKPSMWLRELTPAELERWRRMIETQERLRREAATVDGVKP